VVKRKSCNIEECTASLFFLPANSAYILVWRKVRALPGSKNVPAYFQILFSTLLKF
jgi:hypothetical protein